MFVELGSECPSIDEMVSSETPLCTSAEAVLCLKKWIPKNLSSLVILALFRLLYLRYNLVEK